METKENKKILKNKVFFWKGKRVSENDYNTRKNQQSRGKNLNKLRTIAYNNLKIKEPVQKNEFLDVDERRLMHVKTLSEKMKCSNCKKTLGFDRIVEEKKMGFASIFYISCESPECNRITLVNTDKKHFIQKPYKNITKAGK